MARSRRCRGCFPWTRRWRTFRWWRLHPAATRWPRRLSRCPSRVAASSVPEPRPPPSRRAARSTSPPWTSYSRNARLPSTPSQPSPRGREKKGTQTSLDRPDSFRPSELFLPSDSPHHFAEGGRGGNLFPPHLFASLESSDQVCHLYRRLGGLGSLVVLGAAPGQSLIAVEGGQHAE